VKVVKALKALDNFLIVVTMPQRNHLVANIGRSHQMSNSYPTQVLHFQQPG